ncbi:RHS Repeat family protein [Alcanivorax sp. S71-1-4]|nr:RHS Repeat family protein [Alcanivorax sp. S71-1-4]
MYLALETNGKVSDWTNAVSRTWGVNGDVKAQVLGYDGTRYIGGSFTMAGMNVGSVALFPVNDDLSNPHLLAMPEANGEIHAVASDGEGGWYIAGDFTRFGNFERLRLAHIDGSGRISNWNPGANGTVRALVVSNDTVYAGGDFTAAGNGNAAIARNKLASFSANGSLTNWNPYANGLVRALALGDDGVFVGGEFTQIGGGPDADTRTGLAKIGFNGDLLSWRSSISGKFNALLFHNGSIYAGGDFTQGSRLQDGNQYSIPAGRYINNLVALPSAGDGAVSPSSHFQYFAVGGVVNSIISSDSGGVLIGGTFSDVVRYHFSAGSNQFSIRYHESLCSSHGYVNISSGVCINDVPTTGSVSAIAQVEDDLLLARSNENFWGIEGGSINTIATDGGSILIAGNFHIAGGHDRLGLASFDNQGFLGDWAPGANGVVHTMTKRNGVIYAGGDFTFSGAGIANTARNRLAAFDEEGNLLSWNPGANGRVNSLVVLGGNIYAAGSFTSAGGEPRSRLASFDLSGNLMNWNAEIQGTDQVASVLTAIDGVIYVGGLFTSASGASGVVSRTNLAAFDAEGNIQSWAPQTDGAVTVFGLTDNTLYIAGDFSSASGSTGGGDRHGLAAFDLAGSLQPWNPGVSGGEVKSITALDDLIYVGGSFTAAGDGFGNTARQGLAAFTSDGLLSDWRPEVSDSVQSLVGSSGTLYVGGGFSSAHDGEYWIPRSRLAAFGSDGGLLDK